MQILHQNLHADSRQWSVLARGGRDRATEVLSIYALQVARLMEMGFSRIDALEALRASNNDLNVATNFLLQH
ncbi:hypothetical protein lerEdw1_017071 [Lerista edwardsae]|nr:hypothetical protein lerEdw1_017071 [Lerista edwardsae]